MTEMDRISPRLPCSVLMAVVFLLAADAHSHPYDSPLEFRKHRTEDGRVIYSNIPKKCFANGLLICDRLHPIFNGGQAPQPTTATGKKQ